MTTSGPMLVRMRAQRRRNIKVLRRGARYMRWVSWLPFEPGTVRQTMAQLAAADHQLDEFIGPRPLDYWDR